MRAAPSLLPWRLQWSANRRFHAHDLAAGHFPREPEQAAVSQAGWHVRWRRASVRAQFAHQWVTPDGKVARDASATPPGACAIDARRLPGSAFALYWRRANDRAVD